MTWAGVDVGGPAKGFHAAVVDEARVVAGPDRFGAAEDVIKWLARLRPTVVAVDSPRSCAKPGEKSRAGERQLMKDLQCGIFFTPDEATLPKKRFYEWILCGRELYGALDGAGCGMGWEVIEVFPTASWTVWAGRRGGRSRARWTHEALEAIGLDGLPSRRMNQDDRDALAAAMTARLHGGGRTRTFGDIVVPC